MMLLFWLFLFLLYLLGDGISFGSVIFFFKYFMICFIVGFVFGILLEYIKFSLIMSMVLYLLKLFFNFEFMILSIVLFCYFLYIYFIKISFLGNVFGLMGFFLYVILSKSVLNVNMLVFVLGLLVFGSLGVKYLNVLIIVVEFGFESWLYNLVKLKLLSFLFSLEFSSMLFVLMFLWIMVCFYFLCKYKSFEVMFLMILNLCF